MSLADDAAARVDRDELVELALAICNIDSAGPHEAPVAEYVHDWLLVGHAANRWRCQDQWMILRSREGGRGWRHRRRNRYGP